MGLGCMGMSEFYGPHDEAQSIATIHHAIDRGMTFLDTADIYGLGHNERLVGDAVRARRDEVVIATKFGVVREADGTFRGVNGRPDYVRAACEVSLARLGVETIDLYYQHRVDPTVPIEETVAAMAQLVREGKVRHLGLSEASPETLRRAQAAHPIAALQSEYSLWSREPEDEVLATCEELGIGFVAYSPLGRGFLTGQIRSAEEFAPDDWRRTNPRFQGENFARNMRIVEALQAVAQTKDCTPAQLALAWLLHQDGTIVPIPGTRRAERIDENLGALDVTLTPAELRRIDAVAPKGAGAGTRYPAASMRLLER
jgi:aryl-alcohol dehydrogenase-like predicted oxidoreductase